MSEHKINNLDELLNGWITDDCVLCHDNYAEWSFSDDSNKEVAPLQLTRSSDQIDMMTISSSEGMFVEINLRTGEHTFGPNVPKLDNLAKIFWETMAAYAPQYVRQPENIQPVTGKFDEFDQALKILDK